MPTPVHRVTTRGYAGRVSSILLLAVTLMATLVAGDRASAATTRPTFLRADYAQLGNNHVIADFNGDGKQDIAGQGLKAGALYLGNGDGTLGPRAEFPVAGDTQDVAAGDFNGDAKRDLIVSLNDPDVSLSLLLGNGDGTFQPMVNLPNTSGFDSPTIVATDLNNDGKLDVVAGHTSACFTAPCRISRTITVILGNGDGTFQPAREVDIGAPTAKIAVGDFNRDGVKDLGIVISDARLLILLGGGDGTFVQQPPIQLTDPTLHMEATDVDVADLNRDTIQDVVVAVSLNGSKTAILLGNGDGTFGQPSLITEPNLNVPQFQAIADYNLDGFLDLAIALANGTNGLMEILNGNGDGTFQPAVMYLVPPDKSSIGGYAIVPGDLNNDNKADITLGIVGAFPGFAVLTNSTGAPPPPTPAAPSLLSPTQDSTPAQPVNFDWTDVNAASAYRIQIDDESSFSSPLVVDRIVQASQFTPNFTLGARRHWWRVRGINAAGTAGAWSSVRRFTPRAPVTAPTLSTITLSPTSVVGGNTSQGTATLTSAAPSGGAIVTLSSSNTGAATVPASVTIPAGATSGTFTVSTSAVTASTSATITGAFGGVTRSATLTVTPPSAGATLAGVSVTPTSVTGGTSAQGRVTLTSAAPAGGLDVSLSSSNSAASVPASVSVPGGATGATFGVTTSSVTTSTPVTITASAGGLTRSASLTVTPPGQTATLTVTATGRSGERVTSSPAGINVAVGSSGSASFATGTTITLSATNGRDVVWSGACSSGGGKTRTCSFTLGGNATVTANVQ